ncbi:hypothetical protein BCU94_00675 [Shewanella sp. 10N.286.52.C2]|nr:hypothetical protein BCU94_00675 [Shewanella sp. 10N.286.52.C2]PMG45250.1 hypothetical protein BCU91_04165 [Shewanella sp. 10N.286.52.B9]PMH88282.1 hypothetical protein BCU57_04350 [Shewanella sp. 10N.286.48.B5]
MATADPFTGYYYFECISYYSIEHLNELRLNKKNESMSNVTFYGQTYYNLLLTFRTKNRQFFGV